MLVLARHDRAGKDLLQRIELRFEPATIGEFEKADATIVRCGDNRSQRTFHPRNNDAVQIMTCTWRTSERARECVAKSAVRLIAVAERDIVKTCALLQLIES